MSKDAKKALIDDELLQTPQILHLRAAGKHLQCRLLTMVAEIQRVDFGIEIQFDVPFREDIMFQCKLSRLAADLKTWGYGGRDEEEVTRMEIDDFVELDNSRGGEECEFPDLEAQFGR